MITILGRPIAKKNNVRFNGKFTYKTKAWSNFEKDALTQLLRCRERYTGKIDISYIFKMKGCLDSDLDNMEAGINDILQKAGIIDDDKNIISKTSYKESGHKEWITEITIANL